MACDCCYTIVQAPAPSRPIEHGIAGPGLLAHVFVAKFADHLQADTYAGFNTLFENGRSEEAACWAHARRKFYEMHVARPSALTTEALRRIDELYAIEADIRGKPPDPPA